MLDFTIWYCLISFIMGWWVMYKSTLNSNGVELWKCILLGILFTFVWPAISFSLIALSVEELLTSKVRFYS